MVRPVPSSVPVTLGYRQKMKSRPTYIHRGIDFGAPVGTQIVATEGGTVVHAGLGGLNADSKTGTGFGIHVVVKTPDGIYCVYGHQSKVQVKKGQVVKTGDKIGLTGQTGDVTGPHLHYGELTAYSYISDRKPEYVDSAAAPSKPPVRVTAVWGKPDTWRIGSIGPDVTLLGQRLQVWAKHYGLPNPYTVGPSPEFSEVDRRAVEAFQKKQGWTGTGADGLPGAETFKRLAADPPEPAVVLNALFWNIAGSDANNGYGARNATRGPAVGAYAHKIGFDVFLACEASQDNLRHGVSEGLGTIGATEWESKAKAIWYNTATVKHYTRKVYDANPFYYLKSAKYGAAFFGEKDEIPFSILVIHTDYRKPAKQAAQVKAIYLKWIVDCDRIGVKVINRFVVGDFNWDGTSGDNPFNALDGYKFEDKGNPKVMTFMERKRLDSLLAHEASEASVAVPSRANLSDHNPIHFKATLIK